MELGQNSKTNSYTDSRLFWERLLDIYWVNPFWLLAERNAYCMPLYCIHQSLFLCIYFSCRIHKYILTNVPSTYICMYVHTFVHTYICYSKFTWDRAVINIILCTSKLTFVKIPILINHIQCSKVNAFYTVSQNIFWTTNLFPISPKLSTLFPSTHTPRSQKTGSRFTFFSLLRRKH